MKSSEIQFEISRIENDIIYFEQKLQELDKLNLNESQFNNYQKLWLKLIETSKENLNKLSKNI